MQGVLIVADVDFFGRHEDMAVSANWGLPLVAVLIRALLLGV